MRAGLGRAHPTLPANPRGLLSPLLADAEMLGGPDPELAATMGFSGFGALRCGPGAAGRPAEGRGGWLLGAGGPWWGALGRLQPPVGGGNDAVVPGAPRPSPALELPECLRPG